MPRDPRRDGGIQADQAYGAEVGCVAHGFVGGTRDVEVPAQRAPVVVVAGQDEERRAERSEERAGERVLRVGRVVGQVSGDENRVRRHRQTTDRLNGCGEAGDRVEPGTCPRRSDVRIAELRDQERAGHPVPRRAAASQVPSPTAPSPTTSSPTRRNPRRSAPCDV